MDQNSIWSKRYSDVGKEYLFGTEPNRFLARREELLQAGHNAIPSPMGKVATRSGWLNLDWR